MFFAATWVGYTVSTTPERTSHDMPFFDFGKVVPDDVDVVYGVCVAGIKLQNTGGTNVSFKMPSASVMSRTAVADPQVYSAFSLSSAGYDLRYTLDTADFTADPSTWTALVINTDVALSDIVLDENRIGYSQPFALAIGVPAAEAKKMIRKISLQAQFDTVDT